MGESNQSSFVFVHQIHQLSNVIYLQRIGDFFKMINGDTAEIEEARADFRKLDILMAKANVTETLEWEGRYYTITEAIELAKQMRSEVAELKRLAGRRKEEIQRGFRGSTTVTRTLYEPEEMRKKAIELEKRTNRLSQLIDKRNYQVEIDFPEAEKYLG